MSTLLFVLPLLNTMSVVTPPNQPTLHSVACKVKHNDKCIDGAARVGGDGGAGGNVPIIINGGNIYLMPQGGAGGAGGDAPAEVITERITKCSLKIAGKVIVDAKGCDFEKREEQFAMTAPGANGKYEYVMKVVYNEDETGNGFVSSSKTPEERDLGKMTRDGACWLSVDESVRMCAWK